MKIRNIDFIDKTHIMAIVNLTPDSFNPASRQTIDTVLNRVETCIKEGAEVIDLGAQSTRPGHIPVSYEEELKRLLPSLDLIRKNFPDIPISVDTYYPEVAKEALLHDADLINDIWGLQYKDKSMAKVIGDMNASCCIMHNANSNVYNDFYEGILNFLRESLRLAKEAKIDPNKILIDGGIGFAKDFDQNWELLRNYDKLDVLGYPLLLGTSRKRMFGGEVETRLQGTLDSTYLACQKNILFVRVHDIKENMKVIKDYYGIDY